MILLKFILIIIITINYYPFVELLVEINPILYQYLTDLGLVKYKFKKLNDIEFIHGAIKKGFISIVETKIKLIPKEYKASVYNAACNSGNYKIINICESDGMEYRSVMGYYYLNSIFKNCYRKAKELTKYKEKYGIEILGLSIYNDYLEIYKKTFNFTLDPEIIFIINSNAKKILKYVLNRLEISKKQLQEFYNHSIIVGSEDCRVILQKFLN